MRKRTSRAWTAFEGVCALMQAAGGRGRGCGRDGRDRRRRGRVGTEWQPFEALQFQECRACESSELIDLQQLRQRLHPGPTARTVQQHLPAATLLPRTGVWPGLLQVSVSP